MVSSSLSMCMKSDKHGSPYFFLTGHSKDTVCDHTNVSFSSLNPGFLCFGIVRCFHIKTCFITLKSPKLLKIFLFFLFFCSRSNQQKSHRAAGGSKISEHNSVPDWKINQPPTATYGLKNKAIWVCILSQPGEMNMKYYSRLFTQ